MVNNFLSCGLPGPTHHLGTDERKCVRCESSIFNIHSRARQAIKLIVRVDMLQRSAFHSISRATRSEVNS